MLNMYCMFMFLTICHVLFYFLFYSHCRWPYFPSLIWLSFLKNHSLFLHICLFNAIFSLLYLSSFFTKLSSPSSRSHLSAPLPCLTSCFSPHLLFFSFCFHMIDVLHVCLSQTKMSAARTTAAASTSASTRWARTFVSVATALYCMRTNMTVRKVGFTCTHISTHTGIKAWECTCTCRHIHTSMCPFTRTVCVRLTARTLFILIRVLMTADWTFPFEDCFLYMLSAPDLKVWGLRCGDVLLLVTHMTTAIVKMGWLWLKVCKTWLAWNLNKSLRNTINNKKTVSGRFSIRC